MINSLSSRQKGLLCVLITALCWSFLALFLKYALIHTDSYTIVWYRMIAPFFILLLWFWFRGEASDIKVLWAKPGALTVAGLALSYNYIGFMEGVHFTSPANAQIFIQLGPLLLAASGVFFFKERLSLVQKIGFLFCGAGFAGFFFDRMNREALQSEMFFKGMFWIVTAAISWTVFASIQKSQLKVWKSSQINLSIYALASLVFLPWVDFKALSQLSWAVHGLLFFLGLNTLIAYGCLSIALKYLPATQVSPIITLNPLLTLIFIATMDALQWTYIPQDPIGLIGYLGAVSALVGVAMVVAQKKSSTQ